MPRLVALSSGKLSLFHYPSFSLYRCLPRSLSPSLSFYATVWHILHLISSSSVLPSVCCYSPVVLHPLFVFFSPPSASLFAHIQTQTAVTRGRRLSPDTSLSGDIQTTLDCVCLLRVCVHPPLFIEREREIDR